MARIALFHPGFEVPGGAELLCLEQARCLASLGDEVTVLTMAFDEERFGPAREQGPPIRIVPPFERRLSDFLAGPSSDARRLARARRVTESFGEFDVVVAHNHPCNSLLGASSVTARKVWQCNEPPRYLHPRGANPTLTSRVESLPEERDDERSASWRNTLRAHDGKSEGLRGRFDAEQTAKLDHVYAISRFSRDNARRIYGRCGQEVVYPIVRFPEATRGRAGLDRGELGILVQSRLEAPKNVDTVIRGFAAFQRRNGRARLHVVGEGGARASLESLAASLLPDGAAVFHGYLSDEVLGRVCDRCDVFALLPIDEPFGLVYPEAAARGLLLVGPDHGGPREILEDGKLGWCVDAFEPEALSCALDEINTLSDADADRLRAKADAACRARFSGSVIGPQLRRVILEGRP